MVFVDWLMGQRSGRKTSEQSIKLSFEYYQFYTMIQSKSKQQLLLLAEAAERCQRYDDMLSYVGDIINKNSNLTLFQRGLIKTAFKYCLGNKQREMREINRFCQNPTIQNHPFRQSLIQEKDKIYNEYVEKLQKILPLLDILIANADRVENIVFYSNLKGSFLKNHFNICPQHLKHQIAQQARQTFELSLSQAKYQLHSTHPTKLEFLSSYSIFLYEIEQNVTSAIQIAKQAFNAALQDIDKISEQQYKDATMALGLIRDNITLWESVFQNETD